MSKSSHLIGSDVQNHVLSLGVTTSLSTGNWGSIDFDNAARVAVATIEEMIGRKFTPGATPSARLFDPPSNPNKGVISLRTDLCSASSVTITGGGSAMVLNTDFFLGPDNSDQMLNSEGISLPWSWVEFLNYLPFGNLYTSRKTISITGLWCYATVVPETVWKAELAQAMKTIYPEMAMHISKGLLMWREGDVQEEYGRGVGSGPFATEKLIWDGLIQNAASGYKRNVGFL